MPDTKGHLLPVYVLADESASMTSYARELNDGLISLYEALRAEPMIASKVRLSVLGFSDDVAVRMALADLRSQEGLPELRMRNITNYQAAFQDLLTRIPQDIGTLKGGGYLVHRPAVFFLSDGQPSDDNWHQPHQRLTDKSVTPAAPNIIACGVGSVQPDTILQVATKEEFAFVSVPGTDIGKAIAKFFIALTASVVQSGRSLTSANPELVVEKPEGFHMAIDVVLIMRKVRILPQGNGRRARDQQQPPAPPVLSGDRPADPGSRPATEPPGAAGGPPVHNGPPVPVAATRAGGPSEPHRPSGPGEGEMWAPIVVDEPIFDFEPKPPSAVSDYRADTVHDGWSTPDFTIRLASVRGYSHRYNGFPRQDDVAVGFDPESGVVLFAVADGVSSAGQSHIGAAIACSTLVELQRWMLDKEHAIDLPRAVQKAASRMTDHAAYLLRQEQPEPEAVESLLATTLIAGYIAPDPQGAVAVLVQIGDSGAWVLKDGHYYPLLERKNDPDAQIISSAVSPLPRLPDRIIPAEYGLPPDAVLLVGTDGFGDPLGDGDGQVGQLFAGHLSMPPPARGLAHLLDFSRDTFDDDRTLLAIWQRPRKPENPR